MNQHEKQLLESYASMDTHDLFDSVDLASIKYSDQFEDAVCNLMSKRLAEEDGDNIPYEESLDAWIKTMGPEDAEAFLNETWEDSDFV